MKIGLEIIGALAAVQAVWVWCACRLRAETEEIACRMHGKGR